MLESSVVTDAVGTARVHIHNTVDDNVGALDKTHVKGEGRRFLVTA